MHLRQLDVCSGAALDCALPRSLQTRVARRYGGNMARTKLASKKKRQSKKLPVLGAAGVSLAMVGGASTTNGAPAANIQAPMLAPDHEITLSEEELSDVSLATFYVFDQEHAIQDGIQLARGCGCGHGCGGGCAARGCGGHGCGCAARGCGGRCGVGCRGCRCGCGRGCGCGCGTIWFGCGGCSCSCCISWGACTWIC
jgi:hypothetical protein